MKNMRHIWDKYRKPIEDLKKGNNPYSESVADRTNNKKKNPKKYLGLIVKPEINL